MKRLIYVLLLVPALASADIVTEFGLGWKVNQSVVLHPDCNYVHIHDTNPVKFTALHLGREHASCGGSNPIFIGWPIAFERERDPWRWRVGWFHLSSIADGHGRFSQWLGSDRRETHLDCICATATFNWTKWRR